ncbi:MAG TPA: aldehyde dehydrogenase [Bacillus bacterium]|uniref:Aldehyde dehydrogenase n=1 Tax=Siminovitchia fordii TaxID=254759 RepID=A0ABQ4K5H9_9BACI|nr:aldehyde dehydrogenase [Siminovitchia fordii]GIN20403.1 aldehyde dehydrogenase [Siminovitchia fordii]HBZ08324.1 aldehyde dehydrogenase [Bacillus sp. (in: firmicutes)]
MESYQSLVTSQREFFRTNQTKNVAFRLNALEKLRSAVKLYEQEFITALKDDLNKSEFEAYSTEIGIILEELRLTINKLPSWAKPVKVKTPITHIGSASYIYSEPYGTALIISPWNYPFQLAAAPLIGAIAAGNCAVIKPSELTPRTSQVFAKMIRELFPEKYITVVEGGVETSQALLQEKFDKIFFTGSVSVGKAVMEAAAKHLTPVTLELGGKSPCIVHEDANLKLAAKRIAWGKFTNAGQTCIAPDYLYVHQRIKEPFLCLLKEAIQEMYAGRSLTRIVSERHFSRLTSFLNQGDILTGGNASREELSIEPTVLTGITWEDPIMEEEIFGPILPVMEYTELDEVIDGIHKHPNPLALYLFSENAGTQKKLLSSISFGGGCINDTVYHVASPYLPFGGVGTSGIGAYHGKSSFDIFSHKKSVLKQTTLFDIPFRYPHVKNALKRIKLFLK